MSFFNLFTQGGQTQLHQLRMIKQVVWATLLVSLILGAGVGAWRAWTKLPYGVLSWVHGAYLAEFKLSWPYVKQDQMTQTFFYPNGHKKEVPSLDILRHPNAARAKRVFFSALNEGILWGMWTALLSFFSCSLLWIWRGRKNKEKKLLSGVHVVSTSSLKKLMRPHGRKGVLRIVGIPLAANLEPKHMLLSGTTGAGKTNCLHELLPQIRLAKQRAVIVDLTGEFVSKYFRQGQDVLLNPFDARSSGWSPWSECIHEYHYDDLAASMIPEQSRDPFWHTAARILLSEALRKLKPKPNLQKLLDVLVNDSLAEASVFFKKSKAASFVSKDAEKTAASIRATLASHLGSLAYLDASNPFSIRQWVHQDKEDTWLFLVALPDQREAMRSLLSTWTGVAIRSLLSLPPDSSRRLWFIMDELPALHHLQSLPLGLAEARKYGGCFILGLQDTNQLDELYGHNIAKSILGLLNTKIIPISKDFNQ